jgi:hypothetical protein
MKPLVNKDEACCELEEEEAEEEETKLTYFRRRRRMKKINLLKYGMKGSYLKRFSPRGEPLSSSLSSKNPQKRKSFQISPRF